MARNNYALDRSETARTPAKHGPTNTVWMGWDDFANGRPYPAEYNGWHVGKQRNYELGRAQAATAKGALGFVPRWRRNVLHKTAVFAPAIAEATMAEHAFHRERRAA